MSEELKELIESLQTKGTLPLQIQRMIQDLQLVQVKSMFGKIQRVAQEVSVATGKEIQTVLKAEISRSTR